MPGLHICDTLYLETFLWVTSLMSGDMCDAGHIGVICDQLTPGEEGLIHADIGDNDSTRDGSHYQPPSFIITSAVTREEKDANGSRTHRTRSDQDICFANFTNRFNTSPSRSNQTLEQ